MPKRTNTFQDVVAIVHRHMAAGAAVEESALVTPTRGGKPREVDVVVTSDVAGHVVNVAIEASKTKRPATVEWVERMIGKHLDLPTDRLILYSGTGFTKGALDKTANHNVAAIAAEEMTDQEREAAVLGGLRSLWPKTYSLTPRRARVWVERPDGSVVWFKAPEDILLYRVDGSGFGRNLREAVLSQLEKEHLKVADQIGLRDIEESLTSEFVAVWKPVTIEEDATESDVFLRYEDSDPPELHRVAGIEIRGDAVIEVTRVNLTHARLGAVSVAYGEVTLGGRTGLAVITGTSAEGAFTFRFPETDS